MRYIIPLLLVLIYGANTFAQEHDTTSNTLIDTLSREAAAVDTLHSTQDTLRAAQDTLVKETRLERRARLKAEKEHDKYYYKDIKKDSTRLAIEHLSRVAWKRSLMVPGWGQYTNKGLWWIKVPIIYGGLVTGYLVFDYWQWYYKKFLDELDHRITYDGEPSDPDLINWSTEGLVRQKDYGRRNRDLTILVTVGWWGLNAVEAYVDSMLKYRWNIGSDMSMRVHPTLMPSINNSFASTHTLGGFGVAPGIKFTMNIN